MRTAVYYDLQDTADPGRLSYACKLSGKIWRTSGAGVLLLGRGVEDELERLLWSAPGEFVPCARDAAPDAGFAPVRLAGAGASLTDADAARRAWVVLDASPPAALAAGAPVPGCAGLYVILASEAAARAPMQSLGERLEQGGVEVRLHRITPRK